MTTVTKAGKRQPPYARGRRKERGVMNRTERKFHETIIQPTIDAGRVVQCWYEKWTWQLTEKTPGGKPGIRYTPDFVCLMASGLLVVYEVKGTGNARREALNRTKLFADIYPMRTYVATQQRVKDGGGFKIEEY